jgi:PAS domain S-box-containing protein
MIVSKLFKKTLLIIIAIFIVIAMTIAISTGWNIYRDLTQEYKSKGTAIAKSIANSSVETLLNRDAATIQAMIDQFLEIVGVSYVFVLDSQGEIISHTFVPNVPEEIYALGTKKTRAIFISDVNLFNKGDFIDIEAPVLEGTVGYVHVGMDKGIIMSQMGTAMVRQLSLLSAIFLFSIVLIYTLMNKISQPLNTLTEYARRLASHDFSSPVNIQSTDEIGLLANTMTSLATDLNEVFERYEQAINDAIVELQHTLVYLTAVIDNMADGLLVTDTDGVINHVNPAMTTMFALKETDMIGKNCKDIFGPGFAELLGKTRIHTDQVFTSEVKLAQGRTGKAVATGIHQDVLQSGYGDLGSVILIRDITSEKEVDRMKTDFISTVSHELRTPLTSVLGFTGIIKSKLESMVFPHIDIDGNDKLEKEIRRIRHNLETILSEGERLTALINDVLDISKLEAGKVEWKMEKVMLADIIDRAVSATASLFEQKKILFIRDIQYNLPFVIADRDKMIQVMINLLSNAVKFTEKGSVTCKVRQEEDEVIVSLIDTGRGISDGDREIIFEKFKQAGDTLTDKPTGTGLGLPICKQIIEFHGGRIWVKSELEKGSIFSFSLLLKKTEEPDMTDVYSSAGAAGEVAREKQ